MCLPGGLDPDGSATLDGIVKRHRIPRDARVYRIGQPFTSLYAVHFGHFKTTQVDRRGAQQVTGYAGNAFYFYDYSVNLVQVKNFPKVVFDYFTGNDSIYVIMQDQQPGNVAYAVLNSSLHIVHIAAISNFPLFAKRCNRFEEISGCNICFFKGKCIANFRF